MLKSFDSINDSFVALKIELDKVVFPFEIVFVTTINMFSSIANIDVVESTGV